MSGRPDAAAYRIGGRLNTLDRFVHRANPTIQDLLGRPLLRRINARRSGTGIITCMGPIRPARWVGREQELTVLRAACEALGRGEGTVVWIEGEPGIGKSALAAEALAQAAQPEWDVGWAGADQLSGRLPLRVMQDCLQVKPSSPDERRARAARPRHDQRVGPLAASDASVNGVEVLLTPADELCAAAATPAEAATVSGRSHGRSGAKGSAVPGRSAGPSRGRPRSRSGRPRPKRQRLPHKIAGQKRVGAKKGT
jgi:hypothetical protein